MSCGVSGCIVARRKAGEVSFIHCNPVEEPTMLCLNCGKASVTTIDKQEYIYHVCHSCKYAWSFGSKEGFKKHGGKWIFVPAGRLWITDERPE